MNTRALAVALCLASVACNSVGDNPTPATVYVSDARVLGAVPVVRNGSSYERVCRTSELAPGETIEGLAIDLELLSTERRVPNETVSDADRSIQVGDRVKDHDVARADLNPANVHVVVDCIKRVGDSLSRTCDAGADVMGPNASVVEISHVPFADRVEVWGDGNGLGVGVIVLLDQSGSVSGFVMPDPSRAPPDASKPDRLYEMSYDEANLAIIKWQQPDNPLEHLASDKKHYRVAALQGFISSLNKNDKLLVMTYNEDEKNRLICASPDLETPTPADCFTTRRDWLTRGISDIAGNEGGRTPLWESLYDAVTFLQDQTGVGAKHIVVLNDGPDTCSPNSEHFVGGAPCSDRDFDDVRGLLRSGSPDLPIHVHFVQYQAIGYPARDQTQMQLACETDGTYAFVNRLDMGSPEFEEALLESLDRARFSFLGKWQAVVRTNVGASDLPWPQGTPPGFSFGAYGNLVLLANPFLPVEMGLPFSVGDSSSLTKVPKTPNWDNSLVFRKDCSQRSQCGEANVDPCTTRCGWESGLCFGVDVWMPTGTACTMADGAGGVCCLGSCLPWSCE